MSEHHSQPSKTPALAVSRIHSIPREPHIITQGRRSAQISKISKSAKQKCAKQCRYAKSQDLDLDSSAKTGKTLPNCTKLHKNSQKWRYDIVNIFDIGYLHCKHLDIGKNQHQLPAFTTSSSTNSASASSLHHQAAAPNQHQLPASTTRQQHHISQPPARQPANQLLTLPLCHTHIMAARSVVV